MTVGSADVLADMIWGVSSGAGLGKHRRSLEIRGQPWLGSDQTQAVAVILLF
jgi:hypothetical protein